MARTDTLGHFLTDVADAIREKKGTSETITASDFDTEIENLPSGGGLSIEDEMRLSDLNVGYGSASYRRYSEKDYTAKEVQRVQELINKLGGN